MLIRCIAVALLASWPMIVAAQVKIGLMVSATGPTTAIGIPQKNTGELLPRRVGDVTVEYIQLDDGGDTTRAVQNAKKLIQDKYVDQFADQVSQAGLQPKRSTATTQIAGADAEGARVRAVMDREPGGMDSYFRIMSDRLVQMSIIGSEKEITKSAPVWDMIRNSLKVEPPPQPKASPTPKGKP